MVHTIFFSCIPQKLTFKRWWRGVQQCCPQTFGSQSRFSLHHTWIRARQRPSARWSVGKSIRSSILEPNYPGCKSVRDPSCKSLCQSAQEPPKKIWFFEALNELLYSSDWTSSCLHLPMSYGLLNFIS